LNRSAIKSIGLQCNADSSLKAVTRHAALVHEAEAEGVSLNQLLSAKISAQLQDVAAV